MVQSKLILHSVLVAACLISGCRAKSDGTQAGALLNSGTGVLLVSFPRPAELRRQDWMAQVNLSGAADTRALPRLPSADLQSITVLHVPPGKYSVVAFAWQRGADPAWGGSADSIEVVAGKLTMLRAGLLNQDSYPYRRSPLTASSPRPWKLSSAEKLQEYITAELRAITSG